MSITDGQVPTTRTVEFSGARPATEVLTWGQRAIWTAIGRISPEDAYFNFTKTLPLDGESVDMDQVLAAIGTVVERHEALCTRMTIVDGEPRQHVNERGTLKVEIIEAPEDGVGDMVAATTSRFNGTKFDYRQEWPLRTAIVTRSGVPAVAVLCFCHLATDFGGSMLVLADLAAVIAGKVLTENTATQPVDLARYQQSPAGRRAAKAAATYWERAYERIPISMFERELAVPEEPRFHRAFLISPAMSQAVELVGERLGTGSSAVLHAAFAVTIAALTEHDTCALLTITKNRFRSQTRDMVSTLALEGLLVVSLADVADFDEAVRASWRAAVPAYRYAQYDELDRDRIVKEASDRRGEFVHPNCCLNDLRDDMATGIPFSGTPLRELAARSRIDWLPPLAKVDCRFCLHFEDTPIGMALRVTSDSAYVPRPHMIAFLKSVDAIVTAAAAGPVKLVDLPSMTELITS